jgi:hypothetical protein
MCHIVVVNGDRPRVTRVRELIVDQDRQVREPRVADSPSTNIYIYIYIYKYIYIYIYPCKKNTVGSVGQSEMELLQCTKCGVRRKRIKIYLKYNLLR